MIQSKAARYRGHQHPSKCLYARCSLPDSEFRLIRDASTYTALPIFVQRNSFQDSDRVPEQANGGVTVAPLLAKAGDRQIAKRIGTHRLREMSQFDSSNGFNERRIKVVATRPYNLRGLAHGQVLVLTVMLMVVLVGFVALATDVGLLWSERRQMQTATDAAAIAAATALRSAASISSAADSVASINGFTNGANSATITVNNPPATGNFAGNSNYVEVIIAQPETTYFLRALGYSSLTVSTRAVSGISNSAGCIYALDPGAQNALSASNGVNITSTCGIYVDSNNSQALDVIGGAVIKTTGVGVVGGAAVNNGGSIENLSGGSLTVSQNVAPLADPLAHITKPTVGSCTYTGTQNYNSYTASQSPPYSGKYVISPGGYCGGISASNGTSVTFSSGTYILA